MMSQSEEKKVVFFLRNLIVRIPFQSQIGKKVQFTPYDPLVKELIISDDLPTRRVYNIHTTIKINTYIYIKEACTSSDIFL